MTDPVLEQPSPCTLVKITKGLRIGGGFQCLSFLWMIFLVFSTPSDLRTNVHKPFLKILLEAGTLQTNVLDDVKSSRGQ